MLAKIKASKKGFDFDGNKLNDETLTSNVPVIWRNKFYTTGNRYHSKVELFRNGKFIRVVNANFIYLIA